MMSGRSYHLLLAIVLGTIAGLPIQLKADDTEIYLGNINVTTSVRPTVLFILDTSGRALQFRQRPERCHDPRRAHHLHGAQ